MKSLKNLLFATIIVLFSISAANAQGFWSFDSSKGFAARLDAGSAVIGEEIYVIGGDNGSDDFSPGLDTVEIFNPITHQWRPGPSMPIARELFGCCVLAGKIYTIGGVGDSILNNMEIFDSGTNTWSEAPPLLMPVFGISAVAAQSKIYVFGGSDGSSPTNIVQIFDTATRQWTLGPPMYVSLEHMSASLIGQNIYVIGGSLSYLVEQSTTQVQIYNITEGKWSIGPNLPSGRSDFTSCIMNGKIYAIGGICSSEVSPIDSVEIFDTTTNTWSFGPHLIKVRSGLCSQAINGKIYALAGGYGYQGMPLNYNEVFTPGTNGVQSLTQSGNALEVFPNPATSTIHIASSEVPLLISDPLGRACEVRRSGNTLDVSQLPAGVYYLSDGKSRARFVKE